MGFRGSLTVTLAALLVVALASCGSSGSGGGSASCTGVPHEESVVVDWITFEMYLLRSGSAPVVVAFADAVTDRGAAVPSRRKIDLKAPELVRGEVPKELSADEVAIRHARAIMGRPSAQSTCWFAS